jgi:hypothetical protein
MHKHNAAAALTDSLRRDDMRPVTKAPAAKPRMRWCVRLGAGGAASHKLYSAAQAQRFVRLAKRWGIDLYATRFGKV